MENHIETEFSEAVFLRTPYYSFANFSLSHAPFILEDPPFRNALFLASPEFCRELAKKEFSWPALSQKEKITVYKYYNRMSFRPTPFGAFSSFSLISWAENDAIRLADNRQAELHLLPSRAWQEQEVTIHGEGNDCLLRTNPAFYRAGNTFRFIKSLSLPNGKMKFSINEIAAEKLNGYIAEICRAQAMSRSSLAGKIVLATGCSTAEAQDYTDFLITEQVLFTEFRGSLVSPGYWEADPAATPNSGTRMTAFWGEAASKKLSEVLSVPGLADELNRLSPRADLGKKGVFYAALERKTNSGGLDPHIQCELNEAIRILRKLVIPYTTPALRNFKQAFRAKFEGEHVPLLLALDPDTGIGYGGLYHHAATSELLDGVPFSAEARRPGQLDWSEVHRLFLHIWIRNPNRDFYQPVIVDERDVPEPDILWEHAMFPPSLPVMFTRAGSQIILDNLGGASALSLIGRFSVFSRGVAGACNEIALHERLTNSEVLFAELHQLSDNHVDNINRRLPQYEHIVDVNTFPGTTGQGEIALSDLAVFMNGDELWLESISLGKRVIPRLPTAYNFHHNDLAIFQMLGDLQYEGLQANLTFDPEKLFPGLEFYPRVVFKNVILSLARWKISEAEIAVLLKKPYSIGRLHEFRQKRGIPAWITIGLSDQLLTFNLINDDEAAFFMDCLGENKTATLREYIPSDGKVSAGGAPLAGQYIALLKNLSPVYSGLSAEAGGKTPGLKRTFPPGSEWIYLKIYCTPESASVLLAKIIAPYVRRHAKSIRCWFFIRYQDPEPHLRIRIRCNELQHGILLNLLYKKLFQKKYRHLVRDIKSDTYQREIERYGEQLMEQAEAFFCAGSQWAVDVITRRQEVKGIENLAPFQLIYLLVNDFFEEFEQVSWFFKWRSEGFQQEFGGKKALRLGLDSKHHKLGKALEKKLGCAGGAASTAPEQAGDLRKLIRVISDKSRGWSGQRRCVLLADLIHMQVNRMYAARQREYEALICHCLYKYAASFAVRKKLVRTPSPMDRPQ